MSITVDTINTNNNNKPHYTPKNLSSEILIRINMRFFVVCLAYWKIISNFAAHLLKASQSSLDPKILDGHKSPLITRRHATIASRDNYHGEGDGRIAFLVIGRREPLDPGAYKTEALAFLYKRGNGE